MKKIAWQECDGKGITASYTKGKKPSLSDPLKPETHISARYKDIDVHLRIKEEVTSNVFTAKVMYFEPPLAPEPDDLSKGDEVEIHYRHICWIHLA